MRCIPRPRAPDAVLDVLILATGLICQIGDADELVLFFRSQEVALATIEDALAMIQMSARPRAPALAAPNMYVVVPEFIQPTLGAFAKATHARTFLVRSYRCTMAA